MVDKRIAPQDVIVQANKTRAKRLDEKTKMNLTNSLKAALRKNSITQTIIEKIEYNDDVATVTATYMGKGGKKRGEFTFEKNNLKNWVLQGLNSSLKSAEVILDKPAVKASIEEINNEEIIFDLSKVKAVQQGAAYRIEDPDIGKIGELVKADINEDNVKIFYSLVAGDIGVEPKFKGEFKVKYVDEDYLIDASDYEEIDPKETDERVIARQELKHYVREKSEDMYAGMRENFNKTIKIKASNIVKQHASSYKTGPAKILEVNSFVEMKDNAYGGNIIVKAKVGKDVITYGLPVEKGKIIFSGNIAKYQITQKAFENIVEAEMKERLKSQLNKDIETIIADEEVQRQDAINRMKAGQDGKIARTMKFSKVNLQDVEAGDILNLNGVKYKVNNSENDSQWILSLVEETMAV